MGTTDFGAYIVVYNFVIGILVMLSSDKVATYAGVLSRRHCETIIRLARTSAFTFGATVAALSGTIYVVFHLLRIGL